MSDWLKNLWAKAKTRIHAVVIGLSGALGVLQGILPTLRDDLPPHFFAYVTMGLAVTLYAVGHHNSKAT